MKTEQDHKGERNTWQEKGTSVERKDEREEGDREGGQ